jgi:hypothetical protein
VDADAEAASGSTAVGALDGLGESTSGAAGPAEPVESLSPLSHVSGWVGVLPGAGAAPLAGGGGLAGVSAVPGAAGGAGGAPGAAGGTAAGASSVGTVGASGGASGALSVDVSSVVVEGGMHSSGSADAPSAAASVQGVSGPVEPTSERVVLPATAEKEAPAQKSAAKARLDATRRRL